DGDIEQGLDFVPKLAVVTARFFQKRAIDRKVLSRLYGLTEREAEIASLMLHGASVGDVCVKLGIAARTARTHLEALFAKTGAHRQSDLLLLLLSSPAALRFDKNMAWSMHSRARSFDRR